MKLNTLENIYYTSIILLYFDNLINIIFLAIFKSAHS